MKMSEKFWLSAWLTSLILPATLIFHHWDRMKVVIFNDSVKPDGAYEVLLSFGGFWLLLNIFLGGFLLLAGSPELVKLFNEWLDKQDEA